MPDFLGNSGQDEQGQSIDYLGRVIPTAFKNQPALPSPGPVSKAAGPAGISGSGGQSVALPGGGGSGGGGEAGGPNTLAQIARALGLSEQALKASDWARRLFAGDESSSGAGGTNPDVSAGTRSIESGAAFPGETMGELSSLSRLTPSDYGLAAEAEGGAAEAAGGGASVGGGAAIAGAALSAAGQLAHNKDVQRAGQAATMAGTALEVGSSLAGVGSGYGAVFGIPALAYSGMNMARGFDEEAQIRNDTRSVKNVLGAKVPAAMSRLTQTLQTAGGMDIATAPVDQLMAMQSELQTARGEFNAIDHAFKGGLTIAGKNIETGLDMGQVKPYLDMLNETQLQIQDALESRGVPSNQIPGYQSPLDWLNFIDKQAFQQYTYGTEKVDQMQGLVEGRADTPDPRITEAIGKIQPGGTEAGLRGLTQRLAGREPDPSAPMTPESAVARAMPADDFSGTARIALGSGRLDEENLLA